MSDICQFIQAAGSNASKTLGPEARSGLSTMNRHLFIPCRMALEQLPFTAHASPIFFATKAGICSPSSHRRCEGL